MNEQEIVLTYSQPTSVVLFCGLVAERQYNPPSSSCLLGPGHVGLGTMLLDVNTISCSNKPIVAAFCSAARCALCRQVRCACAAKPGSTEEGRVGEDERHRSHSRPGTAAGAGVVKSRAHPPEGSPVHKAVQGREGWEWAMRKEGCGREAGGGGRHTHRHAEALALRNQEATDAKVARGQNALAHDLLSGVLRQLNLQPSQTVPQHRTRATHATPATPHSELAWRPLQDACAKCTWATTSSAAREESLVASDRVLGDGGGGVGVGMKCP
jgi:hypothetical protein